MAKESEVKIRSFVCLEIPDEIQEAINEYVTKPLKGCGAKCSWVKPANIHVTLKFLGDVPENMIPKISEALGKAIEGYDAIHLSLAKVGKFGERVPRVVWVGIEGETEILESLAKSIDNALFRVGFKREKRRFSPHLTVGRVRNPKGADALLRLIDETELPPLGFTSDRIILMKSELSPGGSIYSPLVEFQLGQF